MFSSKSRFFWVNKLRREFLRILHERTTESRYSRPQVMHTRVWIPVHHPGSPISPGTWYPRKKFPGTSLACLRERGESVSNGSITPHDDTTRDNVHALLHCFIAYYFPSGTWLPWLPANYLVIKWVPGYPGNTQDIISYKYPDIFNQCLYAHSNIDRTNSTLAIN